MTKLPAFTRLYEWQHFDGYSTATLWFTLLFLPIFPLKKLKLQVRTNFENETISDSEAIMFLMNSRKLAGAEEKNDYNLLGEDKVKGLDVVKTLLKTYVGFPVLLLWPVALLGLGYWLINGTEYFPKQSTQIKFLAPVLILLNVATLVNFISTPIWAIRRTRGKKALYWLDWILMKLGSKRRLLS
jgi:hypothetical protein